MDELVRVEEGASTRNQGTLTKRSVKAVDENMKTSSFDNFPWWLVLICNAVGLAIYGIGIFVLSRLGIVWCLLYAAYCVWLEWGILSGSCRYCYYFGKQCGFGKGRLCSWFFSRGAEQSLSTKRISWRNIVPDFMVTLIPLCVGITILVRNFSWLVLLLIVMLAVLGSAGTGLIRGQIACKYCKQREIGCPAEQLFSKTKQGK